MTSCPCSCCCVCSDLPLRCCPCYSLFVLCPVCSFQPWDVFKTVSRKSETIYEATTNWFEVAAKTLKLFFFLLLFVCVLGSAVVSKASLLLITNAIGNADLVSHSFSLTTSSVFPPPFVSWLRCHFCLLLFSLRGFEEGWGKQEGGESEWLTGFSSPRTHCVLLSLLLFSLLVN